MKIEDKVKNIVETSSTLNIREKADIICLIECYKNVEDLTKICIEKINGAVASIEKIKTFLYEDAEILYGGDEIIEDLNIIINNLKKGLL